jgi:hypothetical protein
MLLLVYVPMLNESTCGCERSYNPHERCQKPWLRGGDRDSDNSAQQLYHVHTISNTYVYINKEYVQDLVQRENFQICKIF